MTSQKGDIVRSAAGRDRGMLFYVLDVQGEYLLLADGKHRPVEHPKRKKRIHVLSAAQPDTNTARRLKAGEAVSNSELRKELAILRRTL